MLVISLNISNFKTSWPCSMRSLVVSGYDAIAYSKITSSSGRCHLSSSLYFCYSCNSSSIIMFLLLIFHLISCEIETVGNYWQKHAYLDLSHMYEKFCSFRIWINAYCSRHFRYSRCHLSSAWYFFAILATFLGIRTAIFPFS